MTHIDLLKKIDEYFLREGALSRISAFVESQHQVENWFKGELILLFKTLKEEGQINFWQSEYRTNEIGNGRIVFFVLLEDGKLFIELKSFYHGTQANINIDLQTCFTSLPNDIYKLSNISEGNKFSLIFVTPNPGYECWQRAFQKFKNIFPNFDEEITQNNYPATVYIAKLRVN